MEFSEERLSQTDEWETSVMDALTNETDSPTKEPTLRHLQVLVEKFGHRKFRRLQWQIINSILNEKRDNCAIMATGYGKSLCYQFPAVYSGGISLVISPLISLMEDQVLALTVANIPSCLLGSAQTQSTKTISGIFEKKYSIVYLTPEFCTGEYGLDLMRKMNSALDITLIAVDEAHCVSSWGHDFRHAYRQLGVIRDIFPNTPILAVTATATVKVRHDISSVLKLKSPLMTCSGFDRPNLYFSVQHKSLNLINDLKPFMVRENNQWVFNGPTIIYCIRRVETEEISKDLNNYQIAAMPYHAGLTLPVRKDTHERFVRDQIPVVVATIAFGMGIDKPDIRNVIHYGTSGSLENYYQEVGRAGRDGLPAKCATFYARKDFELHQFLIGKTGNNPRRTALLEIMGAYLNTTKCRREFVLSYFEGRSKEDIAKPNCCDNCSKRLENRPTVSYEGLDKDGNYDFSEDAIKYLLAVDSLQGHYGHGIYSLFLKGSKSAKIKTFMINLPGYGLGRDKSEEWWKAIGDFLQTKSYLTSVQCSGRGYSYSIIKLTPSGETFLHQSQKLIAPPPAALLKHFRKKTQPSNGWVSSRDPQPSTSRQQTSVSEQAPNGIVETPEQLQERLHLYRLLKNCRTQLASSSNCMPYMVASDFVLMEMSKHKPHTVGALLQLQIEGFNEAKVEKFSEQLLDVVKSNTQPSQSTKPTIQELLLQYPISKEPILSSAKATYDQWLKLRSVGKVASKRALSHTAIFGHLISLMRHGYPVKVAELGVTPEAQSSILKAIKNLGGDYSLLTPIKAACPESVTYNDIEAVCTYLTVRKHLKSLQLSYEEFDQVIEDDSILEDTQNQVEALDDRDLVDDGYSDEMLLAVCDEMELVVENDQKQEILDDLDPTQIFQYSSKNPEHDLNNDLLDDLDATQIMENPPKMEVPNPDDEEDMDATQKFEYPSRKRKVEDFLDSPPRETVEDEESKVTEEAQKPNDFLDSPPREAVADTEIDKDESAFVQEVKVPTKKVIPKWLCKNKRR